MQNASIGRVITPWSASATRRSDSHRIRHKLRETGETPSRESRPYSAAPSSRHDKQTGEAKQHSTFQEIAAGEMEFFSRVNHTRLEERRGRASLARSVAHSPPERPLRLNERLRFHAAAAFFQEITRRVTQKTRRLLRRRRQSAAVWFINSPKNLH